MRRLARGVLATSILTMAACGAHGSVDAPATASARPVTDPSLAASSRLAAPDTVVDDGGSFSIEVTSPEGIDAPGLDAVVSVLVGRPDTDVDVVAPANDVGDDPEGMTTAGLVAVDGATMTGHPAAVVNGTLLDAVATIASRAVAPDLVIIGIVGEAGEESAAMRGARAVAEHGVPALVVAATGDDPDLAAAAMLLSTIADYDLDAVVDSPGVHVLTVPACVGGTVRGPVEVEASGTDIGVPVPDCTSTDIGPFADEVEAWAAGHATLARHGEGGAQAIP